MARITGTSGTIKIGSTEIKPVSKWSLETSSDNQEYVANDTAGWKGRCAGVKDASGSFTIEADSGYVIPVDEGDTVTLLLYADDGVVHFYTVPAIIDKVKVEVDRAAKTPVAAVVDFSATGAITKSGFFAGSGV